MTETLEKGVAALGRQAWFEAERMLASALEEARRDNDFERMGSCIGPLAETRRGRVRTAVASERLSILAEPVSEEMKIEPGCHLVQPPRVGADARRLRLLSLRREIPIAVICREPKTRYNECPIVAIGGGATVRAKIEPPEPWDTPDLDWFLDAMDLIGEAAMESVDPGMYVVKRIDAIMARLDAVPDHDGLHELLLATCREACETVAAGETPSRGRSGART